MEAWAPPMNSARIPLVIVGTRFQAAIAISVVERLGGGTYDVLCFHKGNEWIRSGDSALRTLRAGARKVTLVDRSRSKILQVAGLLRAVGPFRRSVALACIAHGFVVGTLALLPWIRVTTFDEGGYNVDADGPLFRPQAARDSGGGAWLSRILMPEGPIEWCLRNTSRHLTAFDPALNLFHGKAVRVSVPWHLLFDEREELIAKSCRSVFVLPCFTDFAGGRPALEKIIAKASTCDVVVKHPRDPSPLVNGSIALNSPIEAFVARARREGTVSVVHWRSTVGFTLAGVKDVCLVDISGEP